MRLAIHYNSIQMVLASGWVLVCSVYTGTETNPGIVPVPAPNTRAWE